MKRIHLFFLIVVLFSFGITYSVYSYQNRKRGVRMPSSASITVVTSFYPLADFTKNIGGDLVNAVNITPAGAEPHDYEPTPQDIAAVYSAKLFIFNGNGFDPWADKLASDLHAKNIVTLRMGDQFTSTDPHFWLDPINAERESTVIADALIQIDPAHADVYAKNKDAYLLQLGALHQMYENGLKQCQSRQIVTTHNAFHYLSLRYQLTNLYILGLSPDEEPTPQVIAQIVETAKKQHVGYIFFETLVNPKLAQTIATEIGAKTLVLNPIEGLTDHEIQEGKNYISLMKDNLTSLRTALVCQ